LDVLHVQSLDAQAQKGAKKLAQESGNAAVKKSVKELVENSTNETVDLGSQAIGIKGAQALVVALKVFFVSLYTSVELQRSHTQLTMFVTGQHELHCPQARQESLQ
jgi:hypothetical protein